MKKIKKILLFFLFILLIPNSIYAKANNTLTIVSESADRKPVLGFEYSVINKTNGDEVKIDLSKKASGKIDIADGEYVIKQTKKAKGYRDEDLIELKLPYKLENGDFTREVKIFTKHSLNSKEVANYNPKTSDSAMVEPFGILFASLLTLVILEKSCKRDF